MSADSIHQPHDKLFKTSFGDPANAAGLLREEIPATLSAKIDWTGIRLESGSFVDSHFRHSQSDLLFSAPMDGGDCLIYLLFEHQISEDPLMALRLLRYMTRIWEAQLKSHPETRKLPLIIPVVLAQNAEVWKLSPRFADLFEIPSDVSGAASGFIPDFTFRLIQLAAMPFEAIRGTPAGIMTLRVMKAERVAKLLDPAVWDESLLVRLNRETLDLLIRYILGADVDNDAFDRRIAAIREPEIRTATMSLAEQIRQKGVREGRLEGHQEGLVIAQQNSVIDALIVRFDEVPVGLRKSIRSIADEARLKILFRMAIQAESLEVFSRSL